MTLKQFRRMKVFALRMAPVAIKGGRWRKTARAHIAEILARLNDPHYSCHFPHTINWEDNTPLPNDDGSLLCDFVSEYCWDNRLYREHPSASRCDILESKVAIAVTCCIRAACDVATEPSAGVVGFTIGDLKQMWAPKPIPAWVSAAYETDLNRAEDTQSIQL